MEVRRIYQRAHSCGHNEYFFHDGSKWEIRVKYVYSEEGKRSVRKSCYRDRKAILQREYYAAKEAAGLKEESDGSTKQSPGERIAELSHVMSIFLTG